MLYADLHNISPHPFQSRDAHLRPSYARSCLEGAQFSIIVYPSYASMVIHHLYLLPLSAAQHVHTFYLLLSIHACRVF